MAALNGDLKKIKIVGVTITLVAVIFGLGVTYGTLSGRLSTCEAVTMTNTENTRTLETAVVGINRDVAYIKDGIDEIKVDQRTLSDDIKQIRNNQ